MESIPNYLNACVSERVKNIPDELKSLSLWACYRLEPNTSGNKPHKIPYNPITNQRAKINDTATLCSFAEAVAGVESGRYDGLNFAFGYSDIIGIDLDNIRDAKTGELDSTAAEVVRLFEKAGAYIEISPSGTGLRLINQG